MTSFIVDTSSPKVPTLRQIAVICNLDLFRKTFSIAEIKLDTFPKPVAFTILKLTIFANSVVFK